MSPKMPSRLHLEIAMKYNIFYPAKPPVLTQLNPQLNCPYNYNNLPHDGLTNNDPSHFTSYKTLRAEFRCQTRLLFYTQFMPYLVNSKY